MKLPGPPRQPFVGLALAAAAGIVLSDFCACSFFAVVLGTVGVVILALLVLRWPNLAATYLLVATCFFLLHQWRTMQTPGQSLAARLGDRPRAITVTGAVVTEPKTAANGLATFLVELQTIELEGKTERTRARLQVRWRGTPDFGDEMRWFGMVEPISVPRNPGEFDMRAYLARQDVYRRLDVRYAEEGTLVRHRGGNPILRLAQASRAKIQEILTRDLGDSPEVQNLISGIALGLRHQTPEDIEEPFQQTGTLHLFAVAGLHVGIVAYLLGMVVTVARLPRKWGTALIIPALLFYAAVTGLHVSSVRAAIMSAFLLAGFFFERKVLALNSLAAAAFVLLCLNTNEIFATGFQLSFAVVGAIILLADFFTGFIRRWTAPDPFLPRSLLRGPRRLLQHILTAMGQSASVSLAAWIGSLVLILWYFNLVTPISLLANLVVVPIAFFILATTLLSLLSAPLLTWLSLVFNNANWFLAQVVLSIVHLFAQFPGGHYYLQHPQWPDGAVASVSVLDLGAGAAVHVRAGPRDWLLDCGGERDYQRVVREYLHVAGVNKLHGLLLTHGDTLHIGGAARLLSEFPPAVLIDNPLPDRSSVHRRLRALFHEQGFEARRLTASHSFEIGPNVTARVFYPARLSLAETADDQSFVIQVDVASIARILFLSDSGATAENMLLRSGADLRSDIIVKGRHHSGDATSPAFLDAVRPRLIVATSRDFPESERIADDWVDLVRGRGIKLFRQDETGAVELRFGPGQWKARAYITGETFRSSNR